MGYILHNDSSRTAHLYIKSIKAMFLVVDLQVKGVREKVGKSPKVKGTIRPF
jgi:hypothetical protein